MFDILIAQLDFSTLMPFAIFGAVAVGAWAVADVLFNKSSKSDERLERMKNRALGKTSSASVTKNGAGDGFAKLLEKASPALGETLKPKSEKEISAQLAKLNAAGFRSESAPALFNTLKMIMALVGFAIGGGVNLLLFGITSKALMYTAAVTGIFVFLPGMVVGMIAKSRKEKVFLGLPDAVPGRLSLCGFWQSCQRPSPAGIRRFQ